MSAYLSADCGAKKEYERRIRKATYDTTIVGLIHLLALPPAAGGTGSVFLSSLPLSPRAPSA